MTSHAATVRAAAVVCAANREIAWRSDMRSRLLHWLYCAFEGPRSSGADTISFDFGPVPGLLAGFVVADATIRSWQSHFAVGCKRCARHGAAVSDV